MIGMIAAGAAAKGFLEFIFDNRLGKAIAAGTLFVGVFFGWLFLHDQKVASQATTKVVTSINTQAEKMTHEALKAREPAYLPGAFERLRRNSCSDCDGQAAVPGSEAGLHQKR